MSVVADPVVAPPRRGLSAAAVLDLAERGAGVDGTERALLVLAAATGSAPAELADLALARRDALLFATRRLCFGDELRAVISCPTCGERLEFTVPGSSLSPGEPGERRSPDHLVDASLDVAAGGLRARLRLPTSADLAAVRSAPSVAAARDALLARCLAEVTRHGEPVDAARLVSAELEALAAAAGSGTEPADVVVELTCPACGTTWTSPFDIAGFLWEELAAFADRLLPEVHVIARAYGWSEGEILALSPNRRARYLELIEAGAWDGGSVVER